MATKTSSTSNRRFQSGRAFLPVLGTLIVIGLLAFAGRRDANEPRRRAAAVPSSASTVVEAPAGRRIESTVAALRYRWVAGETWQYACGFRQTMELSPSPAFVEAMAADGMRIEMPPSEGGALELAAGLRVAVYAALGEDWLVGFRFQDVRFLTGASSARLGDEVLARIGAHGEVRELRFADEVGGPSRNMLKSLLATHRIVLSEDGASAWQGTEVDTLGESRVAYAATPAADGRSWLIEKQRASIDVGVPETTARVEGKTLATLATESGRIVEVRSDETIVLEGKNQPYLVRTGVTASLVLVDAAGTIDAADADRARAEFEGRRAGDFRPEGLREAGSAARSRSERDLAAKLTLDGVLAGIETACRTGRWKAEAYDRFLDLRSLFRQDAGAVSKALTLLTAPGLYSEEVYSTMIDALGAAGSAAAQEALLSVMESGSVPIGLREAAVLAATQIESPTNGFVSGLRRVARGSEGDPVAARALETLGIAAAWMAEAGQEEAAGTIVEELELALQRATDVGQRRAVILGLGNAAATRSVQVLVRAAGQEDEGVRAAAALALRAIPVVEARETLGRLATDDASASVRRAAMQALAFAPDTSADEVAEKLLARDGADLVRSEAIQYIASAVERRPVWGRALLDRAASSDPSDEVRTHARQAVEELSLAPGR